MLEAIRTLNSFGLEVASGIILGLDSDTPETETHRMTLIANLLVRVGLLAD